MSRGLGFSWRMDEPPSFTLFAITIHHHRDNDGSPCALRSGIIFTLAGFNLAIGIYEQ